MKTCIVCRKEKNIFNIEHIIPDSVGGTLKIDSVCSECNSQLGAKIDKHLVNHFFCIVKREALKLKSQNGIIPNSFDSHFFSSKDDSAQRIKFDKTSNTFIVIPKIDDKGASFDPTDIENIKKFIKKHKLDANKAKVETINELKGEICIDTVKLSIALLKIAYEFAINEVQQYFEDEKAKKISTIICDIAYRKSQSNILDASGINFRTSLIKSDVFAPFEKYIDINSDNHLIIMFSSKKTGLICNVKIFDMIFFSVQLSEQEYDIETIIFENELEKPDNKPETLPQFMLRKIG